MNQEIKQKLQLSVQRALLGMINKSVRAIAVGTGSNSKLKFTVYLDRPPVKDDYETLSDITGEVLADVNFDDVEEKCEYNLSPIAQLDNLDFWAYVRKE